MSILRKAFGFAFLSVAIVLAGGCATTSPQTAATPAPVVVAQPPAPKPKPLGKPTEKRFKVREQGTLIFNLPAGWRYQTFRTSKLVPMSFRLDAPDKSAAMRVSVSWDGIGIPPKAPTERELENDLRVIGGQRIHHSEEHNTNVKNLLIDGGYVKYAQFTDSMWVHADVPEGNYRYTTDGVFRCGNLWGSFVIFSQDKSGETFRPALAVVQSLHQLER